MRAASPAAQTVRDTIEASRYFVLATADTAGRPWSSPVYFAHIGFTEFFWVSSPAVTHSRNIEVRPEVGIVVFDSQAAIGAGQGVYMSAVARLLEDDETAKPALALQMIERALEFIVFGIVASAEILFCVIAFFRTL